MNETENQSPEEAAVEEDLDSLVEDLRRERDEYLELAQRARADFENYRKRATREGQDALLRGKTEVGRAVLPALDNLERALEADGDGLAEGVALVHRELASGLASAGIEPIDPAGEAFDPNLHEALSSRPPEDGEELRHRRRDRPARLPARRNADPSRAGGRDELGRPGDGA